MQKRKHYWSVKFPPHVVQEAIDFISKTYNCEAKFNNSLSFITHTNEKLHLDTLHDWLVEYPRALGYWLEVDFYTETREGISLGISSMQEEKPWMSISVRSPLREDVDRIFNFFDSREKANRIPFEIAVFIGHGRDAQWRDLKDHLTDHHSIKVIAYEVGPRAGKSVKEVLQEMLDGSSFALIVLTGEDQRNDGALLARENVIHELGLFQGRLGFTKALALLEEGVNEFSNIFGVNQIRFPQGHIRETFGEVIATINREFSQK